MSDYSEISHTVRYLLILLVPKYFHEGFFTSLCVHPHVFEYIVFPFSSLWYTEGHNLIGQDPLPSIFQLGGLATEV